MELPKSITPSTDLSPVASLVDSDLELVSRVQEGELASFDKLVHKYRQRLFSVIYNLTSNREDTADLVQDTFIKAFRSIGRFKGKSSFFTWLYRIGVNTTLSHLKKNKARRFFSFEKLNEEVSRDNAFEALVSKSASDQSALLKELQEKLNEALQKLSNKHRTIVVLFEIEGLSHKEIASIMKCSEGTIRSRLHYAKQQLQGFLSDFLG
jgi:RNA polymerase sigma-70 factor, ECF subfamily